MAKRDTSGQFCGQSDPLADDLLPSEARAVGRPYYPVTPRMRAAHEATRARLRYLHELRKQERALTSAERLESTQTPFPSFGERVIAELHRGETFRPTHAFAPERAQSDSPPVPSPETQTRATGLIERADAWLAETPAGNAATLVAIGAFLLALLAAALVGGK